MKQFCKLLLLCSITLSLSLFAYDGCMDSWANNYDPDATSDDGSCTYDPVDNFIDLLSQLYPQQITKIM